MNKDIRVRQIENAYILSVTSDTDDKYEVKEYSYLSIDNVITHLQEVFNNNAK